MLQSRRLFKIGKLRCKLLCKKVLKCKRIQNPPKANLEAVKLENLNVSKLVIEPGWKWSTCIKPAIGRVSCQAGYVGVVISGNMTCYHDDGSEVTVGEGVTFYSSPGHDGWVIVDEPFVLYGVVEGFKDFGPWKHTHGFANFATAHVA